MSEEQTLSPKYCSKELGEILYRDKLLSISKYEPVSNLLRKYNKNFEYNKQILDDLLNEKTKNNILEITPIEKFGYNEEYLNILKNLNINEIEDNPYRLCNGITEKGFLEINNNYIISKDLQVLYGFYITTKDIKNKIVAEKNKPKYTLSYTEAEFINNLTIDSNEKILLIGADLGYLAYKYPSIEMSVYEEDLAFKEFLERNIYPHFNKNIKFIDNFEINLDSFDKIIINPSYNEELQLKYFYDLELYNSKKIYTPKLDLIINKFKLDLQDLIMTDKEQVIDSLIEGLKEMKGIGQLILDVQMDFLDKAEKYLLKNDLYFDNYKKYQKFIKNNENIYTILREY